jgi:hypothetical protein
MLRFFKAIATHTIFDKFAQILTQVWRGVYYFSILRDFEGLSSLKLVAGKSGKFGDCI